MGTKRSLKWQILSILTAAMLFVSSGYTQNSNQQSIPDAPSATRPFPKPSVSPTAPPAAPESQQQPSPDSGETQEPPEQAPPPANIATMPEGQTPTQGNTNSRDELFTFIVRPTFVQVPVTVKDEQGRLVEGLLPRDFRILENGEPQQIRFFTSDPFPLSAAVVLDTGMSDQGVARVRETLPALVGAFGQFDEVSVYTYGNTVQRVQGFVPAQNDVFLQTVKKLQKNATGRPGGVPVVSGPLASGPTINGRPADPGAAATVNAAQNPNNIYRPQSRVLNDAILEAAQDLGARDRARRKVLFVISNGRELGSDASYSEVLKVLLTQQITVYAIGVEEAAIPVYRQLSKIRLPGQGYGDILPKYATATGGQVFNEFTRDAIETAYGQVTQEARNQYTIGYMARDTKASTYRSIEVLVRRPNVNVIARDGYYPLPPGPK